MNENEEYFKFEDRNFLNPTTSRDEQLQFIETLRDTMGQKSAQVNADTYALGSQLPSNLGGLSGAEETFEARYRTPQLNQSAANLRLAAQQSALNAALSNLQNAYKNRYNQAMLNYQKRAATPSNNTQSTDPYAGGVDIENPTQNSVSSSIAGGVGNTMTVLGPDGKTAHVYQRNPDGSQGPLLGTVTDGVFTPINSTSGNSSKVGALSSTANPGALTVLGQLLAPTYNKETGDWSLLTANKRPGLGGGGW